METEFLGNFAIDTVFLVLYELHDASVNDFTNVFETRFPSDRPIVHLCQAQLAQSNLFTSVDLRSLRR